MSFINIPKMETERLHALMHGIMLNTLSVGRWQVASYFYPISLDLWQPLLDWCGRVGYEVRTTDAPGQVTFLEYRWFPPMPPGAAGARA